MQIENVAGFVRDDDVGVVVGDFPGRDPFFVHIFDIDGVGELLLLCFERRRDGDVRQPGGVHVDDRDGSEAAAVERFGFQGVGKGVVEVFLVRVDVEDDVDLVLEAVATPGRPVDLAAVTPLQFKRREELAGLQRRQVEAEGEKRQNGFHGGSFA